MTVVAGSPAGNATPTRNGWQLVQFANGYTGLARWNGSGYEWGSLTPPSSQIVNTTYIGSTISNVLNGTRLTSALGSLANKVQQAIVTAADAGNFGLKGQPALFDAGGQPVGNSGTVSSEAVGTSLIPGTSGIVNALSNISLTSLFGSLSFWKGLGLIVGAFALAVFGLIELKHVTA